METGEEILSLTRFDSSREQIGTWLNAAKSGWADLNSWIITLTNNLDQLSTTRKNYETTKVELRKWLVEKLDKLKDELSRPLPDEDQDEILFLLDEHEVFQEEFST